jgi:nickel superoxide dismutase
MLNKLVSKLDSVFPAHEAHAHCDGPCGIYDPSSARIAAEAAVSMTRKILALKMPESHEQEAVAAYYNTMSRYIAIKEEQAHLAKTEILVLWTDFFKPEHLAAYPELHTTIWKAAKLCSSVKTEVSAEHANELMDAIKGIHEIFWAIKKRDVAWYTAGI